ncbi:hypothetical protein MiSe_43190 [Microseira wollei NIES-4236]|uniref:Transposase n=1 Tax=Microseira wollei NIES-4236 TaxID=2530354 RepID=A0AAV3WIR7_9CYAN|nr:hypothetical protein MiSe_43190 [Microseira wollei NIES-4236]
MRSLLLHSEQIPSIAQTFDNEIANHRERIENIGIILIRTGLTHAAPKTKVMRQSRDWKPMIFRITFVFLRKSCRTYANHLFFYEKSSLWNYRSQLETRFLRSSWVSPVLDQCCHDINTTRDGWLNSYPSPGFPPYKKPGFSKKPGFLIIWLRKLLLRLLHPIYLPQILPTLPNAL